MQINKISNHENNKNIPNYQNVKFQGKFHRMIIDSHYNVFFQDEFIDTLTKTLNIKKAEALKYLTINKRKTHFLLNLARKFDMSPDITEKLFGDKPLKDVFDEIRKTVKKVTLVHENLALSSKFNLENLISIFPQLKDRKQLKLFELIRSIYSPKSGCVSLDAEQMLELTKLSDSEFAHNPKMMKKLIRNFSDYKSFIGLNYEKGDFPQLLSEKLKKGISPKEVAELDKQLSIINYRAISPQLNNLPQNVMQEHYNPNVFNLFSRGENAPLKNVVENTKIFNNKKFVQYIVENVNDKNLNFYTEFLRRFANVEAQNTPEILIHTLSRINSDENMQKIFNAVIEYNHPISQRSITELLFYIDKFGSETVANNIKTFLNIIPHHYHFNVNPDNVAEIMSKNLDNPAYVSEESIDALRKKEYYSTNRIKKSYFKHKRHMLLIKQDKNQKEIPLVYKNQDCYEDYAAKFKTQETTPKLHNKPVYKPVIVHSYNIPVSSRKNNPIEPVEITPVKNKKIKRVPEQKELTPYQIKKLAIKQESQEIIRQYMKSKKQIAEQSRDYEMTATRMRNKLLPSLFKFVTDSRSQQRAMGIKNPKVSNADVLEIYQKINGNNKKELIHMLNAKDENGNLKYTLKEIIEKLDKINSINNFKRKQAREGRKFLKQIRNSLYGNQVQKNTEN